MLRFRTVETSYKSIFFINVDIISEKLVNFVCVLANEREENEEEEEDFEKSS